MYIKNKLSLFGKCIFAFFVGINSVLAAPITVSTDPDIILDLREHSETTILVQGSLLSSLSKLSKVTYDDFNKILPISIVKDRDLNDSGSAMRVDNRGRESNYCTISINDSFFIFKDSSYKNPFVIMGFSESNIEDFIYLHELAHCNDGIINSSNIEDIEWREALADAYAVIIMLDNKAIYTNSVMPLIKYRAKNKSQGSVIMLKEVVNFYNTEIKDQNLSPNDILNKLKQLRHNTFIKYDKL